MEAQGAAAARPLRHEQADAQAGEDTGGGGIDIGCQCRLDAAAQEQHAPRRAGAALRRQRAAGGQRFRRQLVGQGRWQQRAQQLAQSHGRREKRGARQPLLEQPAQEPFRRPAPRLRFDDTATNVEQAAELHARRAGRLASPARQTTIKVEPGAGGRRPALQHLLDEVDAAARPVEFVPQQLVSRAGSRAEATVHALAEDFGGLPALGRIADEISEIGSHRLGAQSSA